jgi:hypothetical protein
VTALPTSITAGSGTSTITVTVKDQYGNRVSGSNVELAASGTGNTLTGGGATDANGVATGTFSSTVAESKTISAKAGTLDITQTATVNVTTPGSSTITHTLLTAGNNTANQAVYTTASIAPAQNTLVTIAVLGHRQTSGALASPIISGGGMSAWTVVATIDFDTMATTTHKRLTVYRAMSAAPPGSGPISITWSANVSNCQWIVSQWGGVATTGVNGADAIVQTTSSRADAVLGLAGTLAPFGSANNVAFAIVSAAISTLSVNPGAGFTEISEQASAESQRGTLEAEWSLNHTTVDASWATALNAALLAMEIKAAP